MSKEKKFIDWVPVLLEHRPYDVTANIQPVGHCDRCKGMRLNGQLTEYPLINEHGGPRRVCDVCLKIDKEVGLFDAIMDIWDNYEEHQGIGHKLSTKEFLERLEGGRASK